MGRYKPKQGFQPPTQNTHGMSTPGSYQPPQQQQGMPQQPQQYSQYNPQDWPTTFPKPTVGFDRDGVVIEWKNVIKRFEDVKYIPGSLEAIRQLRLKGHKAFMFADQPNIARGLMTDQDVQNIMQRVARSRTPGRQLHFSKGNLNKPVLVSWQIKIHLSLSLPYLYSVIVPKSPSATYFTV